MAELLENPRRAAEMAARARREVVENWDMAAITRKLEASYRDVLREKHAFTRRVENVSAKRSS